MPLTALDSAKDRRAVQASLPGWIANAWTQPGDLGASIHGRFGSGAACLSCLYLPTGRAPNEDVLIAAALRVPERQQQIRDLLHHGSPVPTELLAAIAVGLGVSRDRLSPFESATVRQLYVEGLCGGAVIGLGRVGSPAQDVHVPLAHQSALAGVLLASALMRHEMDGGSDATRVTRVDVMRPIGIHLTQLVRSSDERCVCQDADYVATFRTKWPDPTS